MKGLAVLCSYRALAALIDESLGFMSACGLGPDHPVMRTTDFYTSHECLLLNYEQVRHGDFWITV